MPQTTLNLTNAIRTKYAAKYIEAAEMQRVYDRLAMPVGKLGVEGASFLGNSVTLNFLSDMQPGVDEISQVLDVTPQNLRDATTTVSPVSRFGALQWAEALDLKAYTNYGEERFKVLGKNQMESVDLLAQAAALQGAFVDAFVARASLDAGTATHRLTDTRMTMVDAKLQSMKCPAYLGNGRNQFFAIMHPYSFADLRTGGNVVSVGQYQAKEIILNWELGQIGPFKLIVTPFAKTFWSAGVVNASSVATTLATTTPKALDKTITVAASTNMVVGMPVSIGSVETANTFYPMNERVIITDITATPIISIAGEGANGGLRFDHVLGETVKNADSVFPVSFGGPASLVKMYDETIGEYGEIVGPKKQGLIDQFASIGWKWYGQYGRVVESWLVRGEYSSSLEA